MDLTGMKEKVNKGGTIYLINTSEDIVAKSCSICGNVKELNYYAKGSAFAGRHAKCKMCLKEYRTENKQRLNEESKVWRENNPEYMTKYMQRYYSENQAHMNELSRKWYASNREKTLSDVQKWRNKNPDKVKLIAHRRFARKKALPDALTDEQMTSTLEHFGGCALTGDSDIHWDHVIPLATGRGGTVYENMIPLRADLNESKCARNIFEWFGANKERYELSESKFNELIVFLAEINRMSKDEYVRYVYDCHGESKAI